MKDPLKTIGIVLAALGALIALLGSNVNAAGLPQDVHPNAGIGLALAALAFLKAHELSRR